jgi:phasin family protein
VNQQHTQFLDIYRAGMKTAAEMMKSSFENAERVQNRQLQLVRNALEENAKSADELASAKSLDELVSMQARLAASQMERTIELWTGLWRSTAEGMRDTYNRTTESAARIASSQVQTVAERQRKSA